MSKSNTDPRLEDARCLWATIELFMDGKEPAEYRKRWNAMPLYIREQVLTEWRQKQK